MMQLEDSLTKFDFMKEIRDTLAMSPEEEVDDLYNNYLSGPKLLTLTGATDLHAIKYLELQVDSRKTGLGDLGKHVPCLEQLKLNNSHVPVVRYLIHSYKRDLGSSYSNLKVLWMARCNLQDLDGLGSMRNIRELYLAYNEIKDLTALSMLNDSLEILDLESNEISDLDQLDYLVSCSSLQTVTLENNPLEFPAIIFENFEEAFNIAHEEMNADDKESKARLTILKIIPQIKVLDDIPVTALFTKYSSQSGGCN